MTPRLFPPSSEPPRVFAFPADARFCPALVAGLDARLAGQLPEAARLAERALA